MTGFTGVIWDARTTDRLVSDLASGVGPASLIEAGGAWGAVASEMGDAAVEYGTILARMGGSWASTHASEALDRLTALGGWFADAAETAASNAVIAQEQGAAATVARLAMPAAGEVDLVDGLSDLARSVSAVAPVITGAAAHAERARHDQRMRAARVMEAYEQAATPSAQPWHVEDRAPLLVSDAALLAEQSAASAARSAADAANVEPHTVTTTNATTRLAGGGSPFGPMVPPPVTAGYAATTLAAAPQATAAATPTPTSRPMPSESMPPPVAPSVAATTEQRVTRTVAVAADRGEPVCGAGIAHEPPATWAAAGVAVTSQVTIDSGVESGSPTIDPAYLEQTLRLGEVSTR